MASYWYSTNGMSQRRLSNRHLSILDQAFERHARIQIFDDEVFGQNVAAIANPYQGTMTAGDLHFGLYRQPPMWRMSDTSLDTLILMDESNSQIDEAINNIANTSATITKNRHTTGDMNDASLDSNNLTRGVVSGGGRSNNNNQTIKYNKYLQRNRIISQTTTTEENCICCRIS
jgi:hypothetical protein